MTFNIVSYIIYGFITIWLTLVVGKQFHRNGYYYIKSIFKEEKISNAINNLLLIAYYLLNIGFAIYKIKFWHSVENFLQVVESTCKNTAHILIILGIVNTINIAVLSFFRKQNLSLTIKQKNHGQ